MKIVLLLALFATCFSQVAFTSVAVASSFSNGTSAATSSCVHVHTGTYTTALTGANTDALWAVAQASTTPAVNETAYYCNVAAAASTYAVTVSCSTLTISAAVTTVGSTGTVAAGTTLTSAAGTSAAASGVWNMTASYGTLDQMWNTTLNTGKTWKGYSTTKATAPVATDLTASAAALAGTYAITDGGCSTGFTKWKSASTSSISVFASILGLSFF